MPTRNDGGWYDYRYIPGLGTWARYCPLTEFADIIATGADLEFGEPKPALHPDAGEGC